MKHPVPAGTTIRCNRCDAAFPAPKDLERTAFAGMIAARVTTMVTCPTCQKVDSPFVWASDIEPEFAGTPYQQSQHERAWRQNN